MTCADEVSGSRRPETGWVDRLIPDDWPEIKRIYEEGIATGRATFEAAAGDWLAWDQGHLASCRLVARSSAGGLTGWAGLSPVSGRCVYGGVAEVSVYVSADARGGGIGRLLLVHLIEDSEGAGIWTLQAGILEGNEASLALFRGCGFRDLGIRERIGRLAGRWRNVHLLERRSATVGVDGD